MKLAIDRVFTVKLTAGQWNELFCAMHYAESHNLDKGHNATAKSVDALRKLIVAQVGDKVDAAFIAFEKQCDD